MANTNQLFQGNKFPGSPGSAFVLIWNAGIGAYELTFNPDFNQLYPSNPASIVAGVPILVSGTGGSGGSSQAPVGGVNLLNGNAVATTALYTVPAANIFIVTLVVLYAPSINLDTMTLSFGYNGSFANDCIPDTNYAGLSGATKFVALELSGGVIGNAGDTFKTRINTPQGAPATLNIRVFGFLIAV